MTSKQDRIHEIVNDPYIKAFAAKYGLTGSYLLEHFNVFNACHESVNRCRGCKGLHMCKQDKTGEIMTLVYDGDIYNDITYCPYYIEKLKKDKQINSFIRSDIPENYFNVYLDNIGLPDENIENLCSLCYDILDGKREKGLYISGDLGVGKTYMCIALANSLVKKGEKVAFIKSNYFINEMRKLIATNNTEYEETIDRIKKVKYLFIDDIGSESVSSYSRDDLLFNILDYRMENKLCTVFTSNLSKDSLLKHYTFDKNDNSSIIRARRLLERIDILSDDFVLQGNNKRRG
ncbi:MAG: ATP-binding protein [Erysipelotrichaceae bacterium]|nr:ATP-binding protein [Erysipelotrichaceae bacterium]